MGQETYSWGPGSEQGGWRVLCRVRCPLSLNRAGEGVGAGTALPEELCWVFFLESSCCRTFRLVPSLVCSDRMHIKFQYKIYSYIYIKKVLHAILKHLSQRDAVLSSTLMNSVREMVTVVALPPPPESARSRGASTLPWGSSLASPLSALLRLRAEIKQIDFN